MREGRRQRLAAAGADALAPSKEILDLLRQTYLFRDVLDERLERYAARMRRRTYPRGAYILRVGDPSLEITILVSGLVKGSRVAADGDVFRANLRLDPRG